MDLTDLVKELKQEISSNLAQNEIPIPFVIKIVDSEGFVGMYIHESVRTGTAKIQISSSIEKQFLKIRPNADLNYEIKVTIAHELIHAVQDLVYYLKDRECDYNEDEAESLGVMIAQGSVVKDFDLIKDLISLIKES